MYTAFKVRYVCIYISATFIIFKNICAMQVHCQSQCIVLLFFQMYNFSPSVFGRLLYLYKIFEIAIPICNSHQRSYGIVVASPMYGMHRNSCGLSSPIRCPTRHIRLGPRSRPASRESHYHLTHHRIFHLSLLPIYAVTLGNRTFPFLVYYPF